MSTKLTHVHDVAVPAAAFSFVALAYAAPGLAHLPHHVSWTTSGALLVLGLLCSAVAFLCFFPLVREIGPARATIVTYVNPAIAVILGVVFLNEPVTTGLVVGFPLILGGSILASRRRESSVVEPA
jgi:drug/metabolite transporter (DMT)-like permease